MLAMFDDVQNGEGSKGHKPLPSQQVPTIECFQQSCLYLKLQCFHWWFQRSEHCQTPLTCLKKGKGRQSVVAAGPGDCQQCRMQI